MSDAVWIVVVELDAQPSWLALGRERRGELVSAHVTPVLAAFPAVSTRWVDTEAFTGTCSDLLLAETVELEQWYRLIEALRDSVLLSAPYFRIQRITLGIEDGYARIAYAPTSR